MTRSLRMIAGPVAILALALGNAMAATARPATQVDLLSEIGSVTPGRPFYVGLRLRLPKGWHTYWKNPGDSGLPPRIAWKLPSGFTAGPIEWPAPERFAESGLMTYGYHGEVVFPIRISPASKIDGDSVRLEGTVDWLECKDVCVSGTAPVALSLGVSPKAASRIPSAGSIDAARARVPGPPTGWSMKAEAGERAISLSFDPPRGVSPRAAYLYADQPLVVEHAVPQGFERSGNGYRLTVTPALNAIRNPGRLAGVLLLEGAGFIRRPTAVQIDVPVATGNPAPAPVPPADRGPPLSAVAAGLAAAAIVTGALLVRRRPKSRQT